MSSSVMKAGSFHPGHGQPPAHSALDETLSLLKGWMLAIVRVLFLWFSITIVAALMLVHRHMVKKAYRRYASDKSGRGAAAPGMRT